MVKKKRNWYNITKVKKLQMCIQLSYRV